MNATVIVLGFGPEPDLEDCLTSVADQLGPDDEALLVDNGVHDIASRRAVWDPRIQVIGTGDNLGFAGGCNAAAAKAGGRVLVFLNSDAVLRSGALATLVAALDAGRTERVGIACGCLRLADEPDLVNSVGNPLQFAGLTWAGECGSPAALHLTPGPVAVATGGFFAIGRELWDELGGFDPTFFAYHEDVDLSLRTWLRGWRVVVIPDAVADHHYEFSRNPGKLYLVERNRLITVLTDYPPGLLRRLLPMILLLEPAFLVLAVSQGWAPAKLRSWWWLLSNTAYLRRRRARVQAAVTAPDPDALLARLMVASIDPPNVAQPPGMGLVNAVLRGYWRVAARGLGRA